MTNKFIFLSPLFFSLLLLADDRPEISPDELNRFVDMCPIEQTVDGVSTKFGHTVVLVDTTSGFDEEQFTTMENLIFSEKKLLEIPPYDRLSILKLDGKEIQASENKYIFSWCRPRNGQKNSPHELDRPSFWNPKGPMNINWNIFTSELDKAKDQLEIKQRGSFSQIVEQVIELSRTPGLNFDTSNKYRKLIIVSDLMQYSKNLDFYPSCESRKKCKTWSKFKNDKKLKNWIQGLQPKFFEMDDDNKPILDISPLEVEIIYLNSSFDPKLLIGLKDLWADYFADLGIDNVQFEFETSTIQ